MGQPFDLFDIFKVSKDGSLLWLETAPTLEAARSQVDGLQTTAADDYLVLNQKTGEKTVLHYSQRTKNTVRAKRVAK